MTPEPAQPAESPEARAKRMVAWLQDCGMMEASPETLWAVYDMAPFVAMLAASTARPTEREAVEEDLEEQIAEALDESLEVEWTTAAGARHVMGFLRAKGIVPATDQAAEVSWARSQALWDAAKECIRVKDETTFADSVSEEYREGYKAACVIASMPLQAMSRRAAPDWSGTSGDTAPATDQAGEVEKALADAAERFETIRLTLVNHLNEPVRTAFWCAVEGKKRLAALDTQRATGRTMGGEVRARTLLLQAGVHEDEDTAIGLVPYPVALRAIRTALQNGGE